MKVIFADTKKRVEDVINAAKDKNRAIEKIILTEGEWYDFTSRIGMSTQLSLVKTTTSYWGVHIEKEGYQ